MRITIGCVLIVGLAVSVAPAEQVAMELGLQEDPFDRLGYLDAALLRAVRLVVDTLVIPAEDTVDVQSLVDVAFMLALLYGAAHLLNRVPRFPQTATALRY